jgi:DNA-binding transcriptional LysR family regulator
MELRHLRYFGGRALLDHLRLALVQSMRHSRLPAAPRSRPNAHSPWASRQVRARSSSADRERRRSCVESRKTLKRAGVDIAPAHGVDNIAMAISLVASTRGLSLMPAYARNLLPGSVVSRPLKGEVPTIDLAVGYRNNNSSPILKILLARLCELVSPAQPY